MATSVLGVAAYTAGDYGAEALETFSHGLETKTQCVSYADSPVQGCDVETLPGWESVQTISTTISDVSTDLIEQAGELEEAAEDMWPDKLPEKIAIGIFALTVIGVAVEIARQRRRARIRAYRHLHTFKKNKRPLE